MHHFHWLARWCTHENDYFLAKKIVYATADNGRDLEITNETNKEMLLYVLCNILRGFVYHHSVPSLAGYEQQS